jgi:hypothetical protein
MWGRLRGHKWRHNIAHTRCMLDKQGYMHVRACTRPRARVPTCTHLRTYRPIRNTYCFSTPTMIRESTSLLRYTYIVCLVYILLFTVCALLMLLYLFICFCFRIEGNINTAFCQKRERKEKRARFDVDRKIILKWTSKHVEVMVWIRLHQDREQWVAILKTVNTWQIVWITEHLLGFFFFFRRFLPRAELVPSS